MPRLSFVAIENEINNSISAMPDDDDHYTWFDINDDDPDDYMVVQGLCIPDIEDWDTYTNYPFNDDE